MDIRKLNYADVIQRISERKAIDIYAIGHERTVVKDDQVRWNGRLFSKNVNSCRIDKLMEYSANPNVIFLEIISE